MHKITQEGAKQPKERNELLIWIQRYGDELWLARQIAEWAKVKGGRWVWKMLGSLRDAGFEPNEVEALQI